ncbi:hypothetical protein [Chitinophaga flava]|uniref:hypothetical protein n=1 Tax=Chitinophaga flava TaxID=2259036 RepID=UPI001B880F9F|nr:hypothetical protein [Chitinophaga flava]
MKVEDIASKTGLGWSLNMGGAISRVVRGIPDDQPGGYMDNSISIPVEAKGKELLPGFEIYRGFFEKSKDSEMDIFNFSFNGRSGKFYIGKGTGPDRIVVEPYQKLQVSFNQLNGYDITSFVITDENGVKYEFAARESSGSMALNVDGLILGSNLSGTTSWYLTKMISPSGKDEINFEYSSMGYSYKSAITDNYYLNSGIPSVVSRSYNQVSGTAVYPSRILLPDGTDIKFTYDTGKRLDVPGMETLKKIWINNRRGYELNYQYTGGLENGDPSRNSYRLMLASVQEITAQGNMMPPYQFSYYPGNLPPRNSYAIDHWGFYNGAVNNVTAIPSLDFSITGRTYNIPGGNREVDSSSSLIGTLNKIVYPSGGFTTFEHENNRAYMYRGVENEVHKYLDQNASQFGEVLPLGIIGLQNQPVLEMKLTDPQLSTNVDVIETTFPYADFKFRLYNPAGQVLYTSEAYTYREMVESWHNIPNITNAVDGSYIKVFLNENQFPSLTNILKNSNAYITFSCQYRSLIVSTEMAVGGLRIKKITDYDPVHNKTQYREFKYLMSNNESSGILPVYPRYDYIIDNPYGSTYWAASSNRNSSPYANQDGIIYYKRVETILGNGEMGRIISTFDPAHLVASGSPTPADYPYMYWGIPSWCLGNLKEEEIKDKSGRTVRHTINQYNVTFNTHNAPNFRCLYMASLSMENPYVGGYYAKSYSPVSGMIVKTEEKTKEYSYENNSAPLLETVHQYEYDPSFYQLKTDKNLSDPNNAIITRYKYPNDFPASPVYQGMVARNIIAPAVEQIEERNGQLVRKVESRYKDWFNNGKLYAPESFYVQEGAGANEPRIQFYGYDEHQNILTQANATDALQSIIWDYNGQYPVAKVLNAGSAHIAYTSFESDGSGNWTIPSAARNTSAAFTGKKSYDLGNGNITAVLPAGSTASKVMYWSAGGAATVNGGTGKALASRNGWTLYEHLLPAGTQNVTVSGNVTIDELRLHPQTATMTTATYEPQTGVTSSTDERNNMVYYEYDNFGRLLMIRDQDKKILKQFDYQYQSPVQ